MKVIHGALIAAAALAAMPSGALAQTPGNQPAYVVTYIEVTPSSGAEAANLLRRVAAASRKEAGNLRYEVLQGIERPNQLAILEAWNDAKAFEAHGGGAAMKQFRDQLDPLRVGFFDQRVETGADVGPVAAPAVKDAVYVITHVDVTGPFKDPTIDMMKKVAAATRREPGAARFDVWQQNNRPNHFTVIELGRTSRRSTPMLARPVRGSFAKNSDP
jgi:quinol monooxygenase YgiN